MATVNIQFTPQAGYAGTYRVIAYTSANPTVPVNQVDITPPFTNPVSASLSVPTLEEHIVKVFALACNKLVGQVTVTPPTPQQTITFKNLMSNVGYQVTQVYVDGNNILSSAIAGNGGQYVHSANTIIATNPHSFGGALSGVPNGTNLQIRLTRGASTIYTQNVTYNGGTVVFGASLSVLDGDIFEIQNIIPASMYTQNNGDFKIIVPPPSASFGALMSNVEFLQGAVILVPPSYNPLTDYLPDSNCIVNNEWNLLQLLSSNFGTNGTAASPSLITIRVSVGSIPLCSATGNPPRLRAIDGLGVAHTVVLTAGNVGTTVDIPNFSVDKLDGNPDTLMYLTLEESI